MGCFIFKTTCTLFCFSLLFITKARAVHINDCKCGEQNDLENRIFGGRAVEKNTYPFVAYIEFSETKFCGGVVINDKYILTADHCIYNDSDLNFTIYLNTENRVYMKGEAYHPEKIIRYTNNSSKPNEDIVLLKLQKSITFNEYMKPICLPDPESKYSNLNATVIGWGVSELGAAPQILKQTTVTVMSDNYCEKSGIGKHFKKSLLCAFAPNRDACRGDSGGPLFYTNPRTNQHELIGIVSWGIKCASTTPGVYSKVSYFMHWIEQKTQDALYCSY